MSRLNTIVNIGHHIKGLRPALQIMSELGFSHQDCLTGTGITHEQLENPDQGITLKQEFAFYRRLITLSKTPLIGLKLGQAYRLESYGVFGYAILSAPTLGDALEIASQFDALSFSHFNITLVVKDDIARFQMQQGNPIDKDLLGLYEDRDCSAILSGALSALGQPFPIHHIKLMHDSSNHKKAYEAFFNCPVIFNHPYMEVAFDAEMLRQAMPLRDPDTAAYCLKQCEILLQKQQPSHSWVERVKHHLLNGPINIKDLATNLATSERSLRRKLNDEGYSFQALVNETRYEQAKNLLNSDLNLEQIAHELGYSEAANFSHAFKRWAGVSPAQYRSR